MTKILLIEDNHLILENLTEYFEMEGYCVLGTSNGREGLRIAREQVPDLIICDVLMPGMNGLQVIKYILSDPGTKEIPFIFSSSRSERKDKDEAIRLGADHYIVKPFEPEALLEISQKLIRARSKQRAENVVFQ